MNVDYTNYYYKQKPKKRQIKWGVFICIFLIVLCFGLFFIFYPSINKTNEYIRAVKTKNHVEVFEVFFYAVEVAKFQSEGKANSFSQIIKDKGGAGYVLEENDCYYVLTSMYEKESDASSVAIKLKNNSYNSAVLPLVIPHTFVPTKAAHDSLATTLGNTFELLSGMSELVIELESNKADIKTAISRLNDKRTETTRIMNIFNSSGIDTVKNTAVRAYYMNIVSKLDELVTASDDKKELLCEIRHLSIDIIIKFIELLSAIE